MAFPPAPSAAPTSVSVSEVTSSSITVQWGAVDCIHRNGNITGYSVQYGVQSSGERTVDMALGNFSGGMYQISGLSAATAYTIEVAAVNSAGTGVYSIPIVVEIPDSKQILYNYVVYNFCEMRSSSSLKYTHYRCVPQSKRDYHPQPYLCGDQ